MLDKNLLKIILENTKEDSVLKLEELQDIVNSKKVDQFFQELQARGLIVQPTLDGNYKLSREERAQLVLLGAVNGIDFEKIIKHISWQEFELLTTMVGDEFGYFAIPGLNFSTDERKYQIDVILKNKPYILFIDCKHFGGTGKQSVLKNAVRDQIERVEEVANKFNHLKTKLKIRGWDKAILIPVIITWLDDAVFFYDKVPVIPFSKLRSFFQNFYVFIEDIFKIDLENLKQ